MNRKDGLMAGEPGKPRPQTSFATRCPWGGGKKGWGQSGEEKGLPWYPAFDMLTRLRPPAG